MNSYPLLGVLLAVWTIGSWFTHVIVCIQTSSWLFLLAGALFFPIGMVHGTGVWLGFF